MNRTMGIAAAVLVMLAAGLVSTVSAGKAKPRTFSGPSTPSPLGTWEGKFSGFEFEMFQETKKIKYKGVASIVITDASDPQFNADVTLTDNAEGVVFTQTFAIRSGNGAFGNSASSDYITGHINKKASKIKGLIFRGTGGGDTVFEFKYNVKKVTQ